MLRRVVRPAAVLAVLLSCTPDHVVGPEKPPALFADFEATAATPLIVITELMPDPQRVADASGEWFEVFNAGDQTVDMGGWLITSGPSGSEQHTIGVSLPIAPGGYVVFGNNANTATNGGVVEQYSFPPSGGGSIILNNANTDWLTLKMPDGTLVDTVSYSTRAGGVVVPPIFTPTAGTSRVLGDVALDNTIIGGNANWTNTPTTVTYGAGDRGTPGSGPYSPLQAGPVVTVTVTPNPANVPTGRTRQLTATGRDANGLVSTTTFTWSTSDEAVATVDGSGVVSGIVDGNATITATSANGVSGSAAITVAPPVVSSITVAMNTPRQIPVGFTKPAFPTARDDGNVVITPTPALTWTSSDDAIATVNELGYVTARAEGEITITATAANGVNGATTVTVVAADAPTPAVYRNHLEFGTAADGSPNDDILITRPQFALSYNPQRGGPNWVAWNLNASQFGPAPRCDCFSPDPALPADVYHVVDLDYRNGGYDRGHMTMSEDRTTTYQENARTFYLTNVLPQAAENNQGPWVGFEIHANDLARVSGKELYVIAGGEYAVSPQTLKNEGKVQIPDYTWKIVVVRPGGAGIDHVVEPKDLELLAVRMPNLTTPGVPASAVGIRNNPWQMYETTVDVIEAATGYDFLADLPDFVERIVEANDHFPTAHATAPTAGVEGSAIAFSAAGSTDPDAGDVLTYAWDFGDGQASSGVAPAHVYADNGIYTATVIVTDSYGAADTANAVVTVANAPPVITSLVTPASAAAVGGPVAIYVTFTDPGTADTHTTTVNWGDGVTAVGTTHTYTAAGLFFVTATVRDDDGGSDTRTASTYIVIFDPNGGFATGGGWFVTNGDKANFGFESRYKSLEVSGNLQLHVNAKKFRFASDVIDWLVVTPGMARVRGRGFIASSDEIVEFLFVARDGTQGVRLKVWRAGGEVLFDNQIGAGETATAVTPLRGGNVSVH